MQKILVLIFILFFAQNSFGQLSSFTLSVSKTDEICTGNGALLFNVTNNTAGATIIYSIYHLPDITNPIAVLTTNSFTGLSAGIYKIVALQTLNEESNFQEQEIEIEDQRTALLYTIDGQNVNCFNGTGSLTVTVLQGNVSNYEIISGPIVFEPQSSNFFNNLPLGEYTIRVNDLCGDGVTQTFTIYENLPVSTLNASVAVPVLNSCSLVDCTTKKVAIYINAGEEDTVINYPLQIKLTIYPPDGSTPIIINQTVSSGNEQNFIVELNIPFYNVPVFYYDLQVIESCGQVLDLLNQPLEILARLVANPQGSSQCIREINLYTCNLIPPLFVNFISAPSDFVASNFNSSNLGPFNSQNITYSTNELFDIPIGMYEIEVTDSCGRTLSAEMETYQSVTDYLVGVIDDCGENQLLQIPEFGVGITTIILEQAPSSLGITTPVDLTSEIIDNSYNANLSPGFYIYSGTNLCGDTFYFEIEVELVELVVTVLPTNFAGCLGFYGRIALYTNTDLNSVVITQAPQNYNFPLPNDVTSNIVSEVCLLDSLPSGDFTFYVTDICGNSQIVTTTVPQIISQDPVILFQAKGCDIGFNSVSITSPNGRFTQFIVTQAPASFPFTLPYDVSFNIAQNNGFFCMNTLPTGDYSFFSIDECNVERNSNINLVGLEVNDLSEIIPNCGSFNLDLNYQNNYNNPYTLWLQKLDVNTNQWVNPINGIPYVEGAIPTFQDSYQVFNNQINYNIPSIGNFRIIVYSQIYQNGVYQLITCIRTIKEFNFTGELDINASYSISCNAGGSDIVILPSGVAPYSFYITSKNNNPFFINNGNINIFTNLQPAIYNFQIIDACGNILNRLIDISTLTEPIVSGTNLCLNQNAQLSVSPISFLNYQWWNTNDPNIILSTTNILDLSPFSNDKSGTYFVRIYSTNSFSCIDKTIQYIVPEVVLPNAGIDGILAICGDSTEQINLFEILQEPYDNDGLWQEITTSGNLIDNIWNLNTNTSGKFIFKYTVENLCGNTDESYVTITVYQAPKKPVIVGNSFVCNTTSIVLMVNGFPNTSIEWNGPNGFYSSNQNIEIDNATNINSGIYTVKYISNGCVASSDINVTVSDTIEFEIINQCVNDDYTLLAKPINNSFDNNAVSYLWNGPNGFVSLSNPVIISNEMAGNYTITISDQNNCKITKSKEVASTLCTITSFITPNSDGNNDSFDLTGLDVNKIEIYNRWGRKVYQKQNYSNEWNGQNMTGGILPSGTYFYNIELYSGQSKHGWVELFVN